MADYYSIITNRGKELEAEALASGRLIVLTHFVVGDSNGKQVKPDPAQIRLINETYRGDIAELVVSPEQSTQLMAKIVLPTGIGGFTVREVGLMTDAGELYAVANCPSIDKPVGGVSVNMQFRLAVSDTSNITLNVATGDGLFLRIDQNLKEIKARGAEAQKTSRESIGVLDGTTQQKGLVQLNSAVNNTSETQASTPAAVKIAMDNANARLAKDRNGGDIPNVALFLQNLGLVETINRAAGALQKSGDHMTGGLTFDNDSILAWVRNTDFAKIGFKNESDSDADSYMWFETGDNGDEYFKWRTVAGNTTKDLMTLKLGLLNVLVGAVINGSLGIGTTNALGGNSIALGDNDTGFKQNGDGVLDAYSNSRQVMRIVPGAVQIFGSTGSWIYMREQICFSSVTPVDKDGASAIVRQEHPDRHFILGGLGNHQFGIYMINKSRTENGTDGQAYLDENGHWQCGGQIFPGSYANFDARYQSRDNYATQAWVLQNFVQNIDLTAPAEVGFRDGWGYPRGTDGAAMYNFNMVGGSSNVGNFIVRYTRKQVNNTWYVIN
ncbi:tail fiber protein [Citrobacter phage Chris1]|nr:MULTISPECIES: phage tail protein [Citrobacter freundii complex]UOL51124.1 tail fiber protein [Citrobacter phage Chris1]UTJ95174.1 phage tail protein [Citrobacter portucalensis]